MTDPLTLTTPQAAVVVLPGKGADIVSFVDRASGVDVLFRAPWADRAGHAPVFDSQAAWLSRYQGGWQVLCPNAGPERRQHGTVWGFHGEAALVPWQVTEYSSRRAQLDVELFCAPLRLARELNLEDRTLRLTETVTNLSTVDVEVMWVHHPAFGPPLVQPGCRLRTGARTLISDRDSPGTVLRPDRVYPWPPADATVDLLPVEGEAREVFGCLTDFTDGWFALENERLGIGVHMRWETDTFPHAWLWQELHASAGFPWYRRGYVVAVEPANTIPGDGWTNSWQRGRGTLIAGGEQRATQLTLTLMDTPRLRAEPR